MRTQELRNLIREEVKKAIKEDRFFGADEIILAKQQLPMLRQALLDLDNVMGLIQTVQNNIEDAMPLLEPIENAKDDIEQAKESINRAIQEINPKKR